MHNLYKTIAVITAALASPSIFAIPYSETYSGRQYFEDSTTYVYDFDLTNVNNPAHETTNSSMALSVDAAGAPLGENSVWNRADVMLGLYSSHELREYTGIEVTAWTTNGREVTAPIVVDSLDYRGARLINGVHWINFAFSDELLRVFESNTWDEINIGVRKLGGEHYDYVINQVSLLVYTDENVPAPVPEPTTTALFGMGLAVLGFVRRRKGT